MTTGVIYQTPSEVELVPAGTLAELAQLRAALEPFARLAKGIPSNWPDRCEPTWDLDESGHFSINYYALGAGPGGPTIADHRHAASLLRRHS